ncbi:hypothetical protein [Parachitinimonas caeni]|uniref:Uncharacterized protein n=1 Tax=Parachitinimonas caeni TaxID=3031301 RepID=A0ABT7E443_9NEIS|nr:hypothetical protein [Parachitinimonas caeni]MDK2127087.1 hypothetical protein [Parachitinimonas caeni]
MHLKYTIVFAAILLSPLVLQAKEYSFGVINSNKEVAFGSVKIVLRQGELVKLINSNSDYFTIEALQKNKSGKVFTGNIPKGILTTLDAFSTIRKWNGQTKFFTSSEWSDIVCTTVFKSDGTFTSTLDCECEYHKKTVGRLRQYNNIIWAKGGCATAKGGLNQWSFFVINPNNQLCQVDYDMELDSSICRLGESED